LVRELKEAEREELERLSQDQAVGYRAQIILFSGEGYRVNEIAVLVKVFPDKVRKWIRRYEREGRAGLQKRPRAKRGWKFSEAAQQGLKELALSDPRSLGYKFSTWTLEALCGAAVERGVVESISREWMRRILGRQGVKWRVSGLVLKSRDPDYARKKTALGVAPPSAA